MSNRLRNESGSIAIVVAICLSFIMGAVGLALDFGRAHSARTHAQNSLDAAVLAAVTEETEAEGRNALDKFLASQGLDAAKASFARDVQSSQIIASGTYETRIATTFAAIMGISELPVQVSAAAAVATPQSVSKLELDLKAAYGWFDKRVTFYVQRPDGRIEAIATIDYKATDGKAEGWRGTGIMTVRPSSDVTVGPFEKLWVEMMVDDTAAHKIVKYSSDDPKTADRLYLDGIRMESGKSVEIGKLLPCDKSVEYAWEDSSGAVALKYQDLFFKVRATCDTTLRGQVRLIR